MNDSVTYTGTLDMQRATVALLAGLLEDERARRGGRAETRALSGFTEVALIVRWLLDATRVARLAAGHGIGRSIGYG